MFSFQAASQYYVRRRGLLLQTVVCLSVCLCLS